MADAPGLEIGLGIMSMSGILQSRQTRVDFLSDPTHRSVFDFCPKHASWMNQIGLLLSIMSRTVLRRDSFT